MRRTGDQSLVKEINTSIVLDSILRLQPISRATISSITGLNKGTVSSLVQELIDLGVVFETGIGESSGGRKPVLLQFQKDAGYAIGVDLGVNYIQTIRTDLDGVILEESTVWHQNESQQAVLDQLVQSVEAMLLSAAPTPYGIVGMGIGIPGIVNSEGQILYAPNLGWRNMDLIEYLRNKFSFPIHIDNEANAGAIGEQQYGIAKGNSDLVFISAGIGIGAGIIINNKIYKGASGYSGELGHLTIDAHGKQCLCGNRGCWELYASENALLSLVNDTDKKRNKPPLTLETIIMLAKQNDPNVLRALESIGQNLGIGLSGVINTFNPKHIIIGNRLAKVADWLRSSLLEEIEQRSLTLHRQDVNVQFSNLDSHSATLGAAYLAISFFLQDLTASKAG